MLHILEVNRYFQANILNGIAYCFFGSMKSLIILPGPIFMLSPPILYYLTGNVNRLSAKFLEITFFFSIRVTANVKRQILRALAPRSMPL
jgi:hypothetical protein